MSILIFGVSGMLGHKLFQMLVREHNVFGTIRGEYRDIARYGIFPEDSIVEHVDVTDATSLRDSLVQVRPDVVINAIGLIKQLPAARSVENALLVNSIFPNRLSELASELGFRLITISTDCVFDGSRGNYSETDAPDAGDLYGLSKRLGEIADGSSITLRTSIIGRELGTRHSIVEWFLANRGGTVDGYQHALYSGLTTIEFSRVVDRIIRNHRELCGIFNLSSQPITKFELLCLINQAFRTGTKIRAADDFVIDRTLDSTRLRAAMNYTPPAWATMVAELANDPTPYDQF